MASLTQRRGNVALSTDINTLPAVRGGVHSIPKTTQGTGSHKAASENASSRIIIPSLQALAPLTDIKDIQAAAAQVKEADTKLSTLIDQMVAARPSVLDAEPALPTSSNSNSSNSINNNNNNNHTSHTTETIGLFSTIPSTLSPLILDASHLEQSLGEASRLAQSISGKVMQLDELRRRILTALSHTTDVITLRQSLQGAQLALERREYDEAVVLFLRALHLHSSQQLGEQHSALPPIALEYEKQYQVDSQISQLRAGIVAALQTQLQSSLTALSNLTKTSATTTTSATATLPKSIDLTQNLALSLTKVAPKSNSNAQVSDAIMQVARFARLLSRVGMLDYALEQYARYLIIQGEQDAAAIESEVAATQAKCAERSVGEQVSYAAALAALLLRFRRRLNKHRLAIETAFGATGLLRVFSKLQPVVHSQCMLLLDSFMRSWQDLQPQQRALRALEVQANSSSRYPSGMASSKSTLDLVAAEGQYRSPLEFTPLLEQLVIISASIEVHHRTASSIVSQALEAATSYRSQSQDPRVLSSTSSNISATGSIKEDAALTNSSNSVENVTLDDAEMEATRASDLACCSLLGPQVEQVLKSGTLTQRLGELMAHYVRFEQHYMIESIKLALRNEAPNDEQNISAFVDEVFFILRECSNRAKSTYNSNALCAIINLIDTELNSSFATTLQNGLRLLNTSPVTHGVLTLFQGASQPGSSASMPQTPLVVGHGAKVILMALNNVNLSGDYLLRLKTDFESSLVAAFKDQPSELQKIQTCLSDLLRTEQKFKHILNSHLEILASGFQPRVVATLDPLLQTNYVFSEADRAQYQISDPFVGRFNMAMGEIVSALQSILTPANMDALLHLFARQVAEFLERVLIPQRKFNQLGAEHFDSDLRSIVAYFSQLVVKSVRDKFARVNQMAFLLNVDKVDDVVEYWKPQSTSSSRSTSRMTWKLQPTEIKRILSCRVDISRDQIVKLQL